jgi:hypothetical protein
MKGISCTFVPVHSCDCTDSIFSSYTGTGGCTHSLTDSSHLLKGSLCLGGKDGDVYGVSGKYIWME